MNKNTLTFICLSDLSGENATPSLTLPPRGGGMGGGVYQRLVFFALCYVLRHNNNLYGKIIFTSKFKVSLVMCRDRHDRSCPVLHENKICDINRYLLVIHWIYCGNARKEAQFCIRPAVSFLQIFKTFFIGAEPFRKRVSRSETDKGCPEQRILPRRKNPDRFIHSVNPAVHFDPRAPAYQFLLHSN